MIFVQCLYYCLLRSVRILPCTLCQQSPNFLPICPGLIAAHGGGGFLGHTRDLLWHVCAHTHTFLPCSFCRGIKMVMAECVGDKKAHTERGARDPHHHVCAAFQECADSGPVPDKPRIGASLQTGIGDPCLLLFIVCT